MLSYCNQKLIGARSIDWFPVLAIKLFEYKFIDGIIKLNHYIFLQNLGNIR